MSDVALVAGGSDPNEALNRFAKSSSAARGIVTFVTLIRPAGGLKSLELSHYQLPILARMVLPEQYCQQRNDSLVGLQIAVTEEMVGKNMMKKPPITKQVWRS